MYVLITNTNDAGRSSDAYKLQTAAPLLAAGHATKLLGRKQLVLEPESLVEAPAVRITVADFSGAILIEVAVVGMVVVLIVPVEVIGRKRPVLEPESLVEAPAVRISVADFSDAALVAAVAVISVAVAIVLVGDAGGAPAFRITVADFSDAATLLYYYTDHRSGHGSHGNRANRKILGRKRLVLEPESLFKAPQLESPPPSPVRLLRS